MIEEHKIFHFLRKHWSKLLLGFLAIASVAAWGERFFTSNRVQSQHDFIVANQIFEQFRKGEALPLESIETTESILKRHPELHPKFDTMLAMTYFAQRNHEKGLKYANATIDHCSNDLPSYYHSYAKTSLLIAEQQYQQAYEEACALREELQGRETYSKLYAMNLLRLVSLEAEIGLQSEAWEELKAHPSYTVISPLFQEGALTLEDWHSVRLNHLE